MRTTMPLALCMTFALSGCAAHSGVTEYHLGPWEKEIGYSQAVRVGNRLIISGTIGAAPDARDMASQMRNAYAAILKTLQAHGASFSSVVVEHIHTTDIDALIKCQEERKQIYGGRLPAATWVQIERLYLKEALLEIEVEAIL
jgi:2-iminobutanoate/2-iminopropanoate deaminase